MKKTVDARGLPCPQPVLLTLKAMSDATEVITIVDNQTAVENVSRLAHSKGCSIQVVEGKDGIYLNINREGSPADPAIAERVADRSMSGSAAGPLVLFVPSNCLGRGSTELGERLMGAFFHTLLEVGPKPKMIIFMNSGVKLTVDGSHALHDLCALSTQGIDILSCGTCLSYYELSEQLAVGRVSNIYDIATALLTAERVVEL